MPAKKNQPTSIELFGVTLTSSDPTLTPGAVEMLPSLVDAAIAQAKVAAPLIGKAVRASKTTADAIVATLMMFNREDGKGIPWNRKHAPEAFVTIQDAIFAAAVTMPADKVGNERKRQEAENLLRDLKNSVKVEMSRDAVEANIVRYCKASVKPPLTDAERDEMANTLDGKLLIGTAPERLRTLIADTYKTAELKLPKNLGGTKTIGTKGGNDKKLSKTQVTDLSMAATSIESGGLSENGLSDSLVALVAAFYRRAASGEVSTGIERETVASNMAVVRDLAQGIGQIYNGTITASVRAKLDIVAGVNAPEGVTTGAEEEQEQEQEQEVPATA